MYVVNDLIYVEAMDLKEEEQVQLWYIDCIHLKLWIIDDSFGDIFSLVFKLNLIKYMIIGYIYKPAKPTHGMLWYVVNNTA